MFIDREADLSEMERRWGPRPQFQLLWGRRRVGKSALIRRFAEGKDAIIYQAVTGTATDQLDLLTRRILAWRAEPLLEAAPLASWAQTFAYLEGLGRERKVAGEPMLLVLDEFQHLAKTDDTVISRLSDFYELVKHEELPLFIIISGSSISFFEKQVAVGGVFGRRTFGGLLSPLGYRDAGAFFPDWDPADRLRAWAILGGMPYYLEQFEPDKSLGWNIREHMLRRNQVLYNEAELLLRDELNEPAVYHSILSAIAGGATTNGEIASKSGIEAQGLSPYLQRLELLHLVGRDVPFGVDPKKSKKGLWTITDGYLAFWHAFIRPNAVDLEAGRTNEIWKMSVKPRLDEFVSKPAFERACRAFVRDRMGRVEGLPRNGAVGGWWAVESRMVDGERVHERYEADVVAGPNKRVLLAGEAKWSDAVDRHTLGQLRRVVGRIPGASGDTRLALFSRHGFADRLRATADAEDVLLFDIHDLYAPT